MVAGEEPGVVMDLLLIFLLDNVSLIEPLLRPQAKLCLEFCISMVFLAPQLGPVSQKPFYFGGCFRFWCFSPKMHYQLLPFLSICNNILDEVKSELCVIIFFKIQYMS